MKNIWGWVIALTISGAGALAGEPAVLRTQQAFLPTGEINDRALMAELIEKTGQLRDANATTPGAELIKQLGRKSCRLELPAPANKQINTVELVKKHQSGVLIVSGYYKCRKCPRWHSSAASGFMLTAGGVFCTSYHVVDNPDHDTMVIMTGDGRIAPILEVLAANKTTDLAILRAAGAGYTPLPLAASAIPGEKIRVLSHPDHHFYTLSEGIIARRWVELRPGHGPRHMFTVSADFAKGSSGAPVFNEQGAVIGSVNNTQSTYHTVNDGVKDNLQMVFKNCVATRHLLELVEGR